MAQAPKKPTSNSSKSVQPLKAAPQAVKVVPKVTPQPVKSVQQSEKIAPKIVEKTVQSAASFVKPADKIAETAKTVVNISTDTIRDLFSNTTEEAQKSHAKVFAISRESTEGVARAVDSCTKAINETINFARSKVEVLIEVCNIISDIAKSANSELINYANSNFSDNLDIVNEVFSCKDINDAIEIQNKFINMNLENFFNQSSRFADMCFQFSNEASEPLVEHIAESTERLSKAFAA